MLASPILGKEWQFLGESIKSFRTRPLCQDVIIASELSLDSIGAHARTRSGLSRLALAVQTHTYVRCSQTFDVSIRLIMTSTIGAGARTRFGTHHRTEGSQAHHSIEMNYPVTIPLTDSVQRFANKTGLVGTRKILLQCIATP